jgi:SAM-dependent methyltransferase
MDNNKKRVIHQNIAIDAQSVQAFYNKRASLYKGSNPLAAVNLHDNDADLVQKRDQHEKSVILPFLSIEENTSVVDIGCGIGRWADAVLPLCGRYFGVDYSSAFIDIANERIRVPKASFRPLSFQEFTDLHNDTVGAPFDCAIIAGVCVYLNDDELAASLAKLPQKMAEHSVLYLREPVGVDYRLTLDKFYSQDLRTDYSAIYRTVDEYKLLIEPLFDAGFRLTACSELTTGELRDRAETTQYYFILKR